MLKVFRLREGEGTGKTVLLALSGGIDSVYLAYACLKAGYDLDLMVVEGTVSSVHGPKAQMEARSVKEIVEELRESFPDSFINVITFSGKVEMAVEKKRDFRNYGTCGFHHDDNRLWVQPPVWLFYLAQALREDHTAAFLAYHLGDEANRIFHSMQTAWNAILDISKTYHRPLAAPLELIQKHEIIRAIPESLLLKSWTCENPKPRYPLVAYEDQTYFHCGKCVPCNTLLGHLSSILADENSEWKVHNYLTDRFREGDQHPALRLHRLWLERRGETM